LRNLSFGARTFIPVALAGAVILSLAPATTVSAAQPTAESQQIIRIAKQQLGDPWRHGAIGPAAFDCSGLVIYAFTKAGDGKALGGGRLRSARAMYRWFKAHGLASTSNPKPGDLVIWGRGSHVGIYIGGGKAISTLTSGVRIHRVHAVTARFTAYLHTRMSTRFTNARSAGATKATRPVASTAPIRHTRDGVNLRRGAGVERSRIRTLSKGTRLVVLGSAHDSRGRTWLRVRADGRIGYVARWLTR
jgi:NlpC/P60 family protein/SH3 domain-containing protein